MNKSLFAYSSILIFILIGIGVYALAIPERIQKVSQTYFSYSPEDLNSISNSKSNQIITTDDVYHWDRVTFDLVAKNTLRADFREEPAKIYAYLAVAQRDFYMLTYKTKSEGGGTFDHLSKEVLCLFFVNDCEKILARGDQDAYSAALAELVLNKIRVRIATDALRLMPYPLSVGDQYWVSDSTPEIGIAEGRSLGWFIDSGDQFRALPPPAFGSDEFKEELKLVQEARCIATGEQREAVVLWAGVPGTKTSAGQLLELGDSYMRKHNVPLEKLLLVRSVVALATSDATTAVFDSKYHYLVRRPYMEDSELITIMPTPNHPSYPSGHSTLSVTATGVLKYYFPEDSAYWDAQAAEAGMSRVWGGIHFIMDHTAATQMGTHVAEIAIQKTKENDK